MAAPIVGTGGYVTVGGTTVARIVSWSLNPQPEIASHDPHGGSRSKYLVNTEYSGTFTAEKLTSDSGQEAIGISPSTVTIVLGDGEDAFNVGSCIAHLAPGYTKNRRVMNRYVFVSA